MRTVKFIRWGVETAATEFQINPRTLRKRLKALSLEPKRGKYSTKQICAAVFGDMDGERLRLVREQADCQAIENAQARGELIHVDNLIPKLTQFTSAARQRILSNLKLDESEKDKILGDLCGCLDCFGGGAAGQPKPAAALPGK